MQIVTFRPYTTYAYGLPGMNGQRAQTEYSPTAFCLNLGYHQLDPRAHCVSFKRTFDGIQPYTNTLSTFIHVPRYQRLNKMAFDVVTKGGVLTTCSCSGGPDSVGFSLPQLKN